MPRISLWKPRKHNDYYFQDRVLKDHFFQGATGIYIHKYLGPNIPGGGDEDDIPELYIQDMLWLENRSRKYSDHIYELRGSYMPESSEFDLSQFGIFISNDTIFILFHYTDMLDKIGRKIMSGDVMEIPHMADPDTLDQELPLSKRYYVVTDSMHASEGYGNNWYSHIWKVKGKMIVDSPEYSGIIGGVVDENTMPKGPDVGLGARPPGGGGIIIGPDGEHIGEICCKTPGSTIDRDQDIVDGIIEEAYMHVRFDPKWFDDAHLYLDQDPVTKEWKMYPWTGDGMPPNGYPLLGQGVEFPEGAQDCDFYLRTDYSPERLFQKDGNIWRRVEDDWRKVWTAYNKVLDTFIDNTDSDTMTDGTVQKTKKAISKVVLPKVNLHQDKEDEIKDENGGKPK